MENEWGRACRRMNDAELMRLAGNPGSLPAQALAALRAEIQLRQQGEAPESPTQQSRVRSTHRITAGGPFSGWQAARAPMQPAPTPSTLVVPSAGLFSGCVGKTIKLGLFVFALYILLQALIIVAAVLGLTLLR